MCVNAGEAQGGMLRKCPVDIFNERVRLPRKSNADISLDMVSRFFLSIASSGMQFGFVVEYYCGFKVIL